MAGRCNTWQIHQKNVTILLSAVSLRFKIDRNTAGFQNESVFMEGTIMADTLQGAVIEGEVLEARQEQVKRHLDIKTWLLDGELIKNEEE